MSDRQELTEALAWWENSVYMELSISEENHVRILADAAQAWLDVDGAVIIRRDENGEWPSNTIEAVKSAIGASLVEQMGWGESRPMAALEAYGIARGQAIAALNALSAEGDQI